MSDVSRGPVKAAPVPKAAPTPRLSSARGAVLQRKCACGGHSEGKCEKCREEEKKLQRTPANHQPAPGSIPSIVHEVLSSPGRPLDASTRAFMEPRFGSDFSSVRVHTDARAAESAQAVNAEAYTVGRHIVFGREQYAPHTESGKHLLAHELTHTIQQGNSSGLRPKLLIDPPDTPLEREADAVGQRIVSGDSVAIQRSAGRSLQRKQMSCDEILDAPTDPRLKPTNFRTFALAVDAYIKKEFRAQAGKQATEGLEIPGSSSTAMRTEGCDPEEAPSVIKPEVTPSGAAPPERKGRVSLGGGLPDLVYRDGRTVELAEVKVGTHTCRPFAESQLHKYIEQGMAEDEPQVEWRKAKEIDEFKEMSPARYQPSPTIQVMGYHTAVSWCERSPGVIVYKAIAPSALVETAGEPYELNIRGQNVTINVLPAPADTDLLNSGSQNKAVAESVPGVIMKTLHREPRKTDTIEAEIETAENSKASHKSTVPLTLPGKKVQVVYRVNEQTRKLTLQTKKVNIPVEYHQLSAGVITKLEYSDEEGLSGEGKITPSIPLLQGIDLRFAFAQDSLEVISKMPGDKLKVPIPGFRVTHADISLVLAPEFKPSGTIGFTIGRGKRALIEGVITVSADAEGFLAKGDVVAHIPGVDETTGTINYRPSTGWSGVINLTSSKVPFVDKAYVTAGFSDKGLDLTGGLDITLPGGNPVSLKVKRRNPTTWVYTGRGEFKVPRLKPVIIDFTYDGDDLTGSARTGFKFKTLEGDIQLNYVNGVVTGTGKLNIEKGKARGYITVTLNKNRKFSGVGVISYQVTESLVATGGIKIDEDEKVTLMGALEIVKPIPLFKPIKGDYEIFSVNFPIPVPGASVAGVGLNVNIRGALSAGYQIGPAELQNTKIEATFDPLDENPDISLKGQARLYIGASAYVSGSISGEIELDIGIAEAAGGLTLSATAQLKGYAASNITVFFSRSRFEASGDFEVLMRLALILALTAYARAEAGVWRFKVTTRKDWKLKEFTYDPGLELGMRLKKPIRYASDQPFVPPSLDDIEWIKPKIDAKQAMSRAFSNSSVKEVKS